MDAAILQVLLSKVLKLDEKLKVQSHFEQAVNSLSNMASSPGDPNQQTAFSQAFSELQQAFTAFSESLSPGDWDRLREIDSDEYFSTSNVDKLNEAVSANPATPAVARDILQQILSDRTSHIGQLKTLQKSLAYIGFEGGYNNTDQGQIGFKLPRELFDNNLSKLISELGFLRKLVRLVAEAEGENPEDIQVGSISTTDPVFWLLVAYGTAVSMGRLSHWALDTWKKVEDIRHVRAQTAQLSTFSESEIEKIFGSKIEAQIKAAIEEKTKALATEMGDKGRKNEIENGLRPILKQFLARVERGLTVDVRYLPAPTDNDTNDSDDEVEEVQERQRSEMRSVASTLNFPRAEGSPVLLLDAANDEGDKTNA